MALIEVKLNSFRYRFRPLTWVEELKLKADPKNDQRRVLLAHALSDVSGLPVSAADAARVIQSLPEAALWRIWVVYRANLPPDRYYTSGSLFEAPDTLTYQQRVKQGADDADKLADRAMTAVDSSRSNAVMERDVNRELFDNAQREGRLVPATS